ncbi:TrkA family potassium uptake protein [uncultured Thiodictyon sp.]|uniref:potassium channel family protein n=1 Tax=uncultured Thiodictyon sp. TaxID=1846217 RepID=UPI0025DA598E|nr:potassium channel family protein [uncultured Thiodictyon sp.]
MDSIVFLIMRRMRAPLIMLIASYAVAIMGLVLIPGQDGAGHPWSMGFFHAFYVVAYTSTTIGFGEIPYPFTDAQRLWVTATIFGTVAIWIYAAGTLIALLQDATFSRALAERRFRARVQRLRDPFYLVCGYGQTGGALVRALTDRHRRAVVIDLDPERVSLLLLENLREYVPALTGDARRPSNLLAAGLDHPRCLGVVALTDVNETNLKIAIASKLLRPSLRVVCRTDSDHVAANLNSFGTDHIYDPFDTFALHMAIAIEAPCLTLLRSWLIGETGTPLPEPRDPPAKGLWILCGYGRFGRAMYRHLKGQGLDLVVVDADPQLTDPPKGGFVQGEGTGAPTLEQAHIERAVALVAGTDDDATNLSIIMTARQLNRDLFVVARKNHLDNSELFQRVGAQVIMHPSMIIADGIRVRLTLPMLWEFLTLSRFQDPAWACELLSRLCGLLDTEIPEVWQIAIAADQAPALCAGDEHAAALTLGLLLADPRERTRQLPVIPLLLEHNDERHLLPDLALRVRKGDQVLFCAREGARSVMDWTLHDPHVLHYLVTGEDAPAGWVWRRLARRRRHRGASGG